MIAAVEMDYLIINRDSDKSYKDVQNYHDTYCLADCLRFSEETMSSRTAMMQFRVEDSEMLESVAEGR